MFRLAVARQILALPIDAFLPAITASLQQNPSLVLEAQPGAGKTTRVPPALLQVVSGGVVVLEPRRIAARLAARRVAWELGEDVGQTVGYQVRFEDVTGPATRLRFVTEGVLARRLLADPLLQSVDAVVLDEFHERHLDSDLSLALLKRLRVKRPELVIVVMSATIEATPIARFLGDCPVVRCPGSLFPTKVRHLPYSPQPLAVQVRQGVELLLREGEGGDMLVFLPGAAEIRQAARACEPVAQRAGMLVLPLHGDLSPAEQDLAVQPGPRRKLILATNVAESSITVEGVTAVIDSGLAQFARYSLWTGLPTLEVGRVSQASARQRAGRAGRTCPGQVLRLYPQEDFLLRPQYDAPEIARSELSQLCLVLRAVGLGAAAGLDWLDAPPAAAIEKAEALLDRLGAFGERAAQMLRYPLPPRLARILLATLERGIGDDGFRAAAMLGAGVRSRSNDLVAAIEEELDGKILQQMQQLRRIARINKASLHDEDALLQCVLLGFADRVARRRAGNQLLLANGASAELTGEPPPYTFMVAIDAEDRSDQPLPFVRMVARIEPEWLLDLFPERVRAQSSLQWNQAAERVDAVSALLYGELVLEESRDLAPDPAAIAALLMRKALDAGPARFVDEAALAQLAARADFAGLAPPDVSGAFERLCLGLHSFAELERAAAQMLPLLERGLSAQGLQELAPQSLRLGGGRTARLHYEAGKPPWLAARLQDFFGMRRTPSVGPSHTPVVLHLLAPNGRAVQTTTDLAGFWERLYPAVRRELMRRYPRHAWPERP